MTAPRRPDVALDLCPGLAPFRITGQTIRCDRWEHPPEQYHRAELSHIGPALVGVLIYWPDRG